MKADEMRCPQCAETIKKMAKVCRYCGYEKPEGFIKAQRQADARQMKNGILVAAALCFLAFACSALMDDDTGDTKQVATEDAAKAAADRKAGFHCLSAWDGSHPQVVADLKERLRNPKSFEHIETRIAPINERGTHALAMKYRAENGFGGMNVGEAVAEVTNATCEATLMSTD